MDMAREGGKGGMDGREGDLAVGDFLVPYGKGHAYPASDDPHPVLVLLVILHKACWNPLAV